MRLIARYASGSLRDAENLLEQLVVSCPDGVTGPHVEQLLGMGSDETALELVKYLLLGNTTASLSAVNRAAWEGSDLRQLHRQTSDLLRGFMHLQWGSEDAVDLPEHVRTQLKELVGKQPPWRIVHALKVWGAVNMRYDAPSTLPLELAVVEICEESAAPAPAGGGAANPPSPQPPPRGRGSEPERAPPRAARTEPAEGRPREPRPDRLPPRERQERPAPARASSGPPGERDEFKDRWLAMLRSLRRYKGKYALDGLLRECDNTAFLEEKTLVLPFRHRSNMERMQEELENPVSQQKMTEALASHFGDGCDYRLTMSNGQQGNGNANKTAQQSPLVRAALGMGARILQEEEVEE